MDALRTLCRAPGSRLGAVARAELAGLHMALSELLEARPDDVGAEPCRAVLREVAELLAPGTGAPETAAAGPRTVGATRGVPGPAGSAGPSVPVGTSVPAGTSAPGGTFDTAPAAGASGAPGAPGVSGAPAAPGVSGALASAAPTVDTELLSLAGELVNSPEAADYLGPLSLPGSAGTPGLWLWLHAALLRLPAAYVPKWRERARQLPMAAPDPARERWTEWCALDREQVLIPPLPRYDTPGVRLSAVGERAGWVLDAAGIEGAQSMGIEEKRSPLDTWLVLAGWVVELAGLDQQLNHCLESLAHRGVLPLRDTEHRRAYRHELAQRLARLARTQRDSATELRAALAVDEALCSVVHLPPAAPGSWWAEIAGTSQRAVLELRRNVRDSGVDVAVEALAPSYREARQRTGGNDIPLDAGGRKGQVLAGLRLWARVDGRELPGRVVYRG